MRYKGCSFGVAHVATRFMMKNVPLPTSFRMSRNLNELLCRTRQSYDLVYSSGFRELEFDLQNCLGIVTVNVRLTRYLATTLH